MLKGFHLFGVGALGVALACGANAPLGDRTHPDSAGGSGAEGAAGGTGGDGGTGAGGTGGTGAGGTGGSGGGSCTAEKPGPRLLRLLTPRELAQTFVDLFGVRSDVVNASQIPGSGTLSGFDNDAKSGLVTDRHVEAYMKLGSQVIDVALTENRDALVPCPATGGCEDEFVRAFGRKAFRRPLTEVEVTRYKALFAPALTTGVFDEGVRLVMRAMVVSPAFLYRAEVGQVAGERFVLDGHELATLVSYTLFGTLPDATLRAAADAGELGTRAGVEAIVRQMVEDPRARPALSGFAAQWLGTVALPNANKDVAVFPAFTPEVRAALMAETAEFVEHVVFDASSSFKELFDADYVFINQALAQFYGMPGPAGTTLEKVPATDADRRGGLLALGSVLATHSSSATSSPIKRGVFVRRRLLCDVLLPPPPDVDTTPPPPVDGLTTRERFKRHTENPKCFDCHKLIDGIGFGLEGYDGVGAARTEENGLPVDESGVVEESDLQGTPQPFHGGRELSRLLAENEKAKGCLATQYYRFAHGFVEGGDDACAVDRLKEAFAGAGFNIKELLVQTLLQQSMLERRGP